MPRFNKLVISNKKCLLCSGDTFLSLTLIRKNVCNTITKKHRGMYKNLKAATVILLIESYNKYCRVQNDEPQNLTDTSYERMGCHVIKLLTTLFGNV